MGYKIFPAGQTKIVYIHILCVFLLLLLLNIYMYILCLNIMEYRLLSFGRIDGIIRRG